MLRTSLIANAIDRLFPSGTLTPSAFNTCANRTPSTDSPFSSSQPQSRYNATRAFRLCTQAGVLTAGRRTAPAPGRIFVTHCEKMTMAIFCVTASFCRAFEMYCKIGNLLDICLGTEDYQLVVIHYIMSNPTSRLLCCI